MNPDNPISERRAKKLKEVAARRQPNITVILENVFDTHNIGAVLRSCDSIGIMEVFILYTAGYVERVKLGKRTAAGTRKWVAAHLYNDLEKCMAHVRSKYKNVWATHLSSEAKSLYQLDLTDSVALVFGNEKDGISQALLDKCDGNFIIPQVGMAESLNISVACAVTLYESFRQRKVKGYYDNNKPLNEAEQEDLFQDYYDRHRVKFYNQVIYDKSE